VLAGCWDRFRSTVEVLSTRDGGEGGGITSSNGCDEEATAESLSFKNLSETCFEVLLLIIFGESNVLPDKCDGCLISGKKHNFKE